MRSSPKSTALSASNSDVEDFQDVSQRPTRLRNPTVCFSATDSSNKDMEDHFKEDNNDAVDSEDIDDDAMDSDDAEGGNKEESSEDSKEVQSAKPVRKTSRSTAFRGGMKDPSNSIADLLKNSGADKTSSTRNDGSKKKNRSSVTSKRSSLESFNGEGSQSDNGVKSKPTDTTKSCAKRHSKQRMSKRVEVSNSYDESSSIASSSETEHSDEDEDDDELEDLKVSKIIAVKSMTLKEWKEICKSINTTEVTNGSRWVQEEDNDADPDKYEERFLIKWNDLSYLHASWETERDLVEFCEGVKHKFAIFFKKSHGGLLYRPNERLDGDYFDPSWVTVDRILEVDVDDYNRRNDQEVDPVKKYNIILDINDARFEDGTGRQFFVKWMNRPYSESTYEFERDLILNDVEYLEELKAYQRRKIKPSKDEMRRRQCQHDLEIKRLYEIFGEKIKISAEEKEKKIQDYQNYLKNFLFKNGGQLRDYQAEGVSWIMSNYINKRSSILADEMGLGKTIQTACYLNCVATELAIHGPFLIIAPLSTIPHWYREFSGWTDLNTVVYHGSASDRERTREDEFAFPKDRVEVRNVGFNQRYLNKVSKRWKSKWETTWMVEVVITTPEMLVSDDFKELAAVKWEILVVDEAHRLKNHNSKLVGNLRDCFVYNQSLLLTGTPIQNNMQELWTLLNFINPVVFGVLNSFMEKYGDIKSKESVDDLHETIRPYILRRLKEDVEKSVPPKEETLIEVELTILQKQYYRALYEKNLKFLHRNKKKALDGPSINNLAMQLRKCCNHPFLLNGVEMEVRSQQPDARAVDLLVNASGKFVLLDKLLPRLKVDGHRILLFSQFKIMLDIIEDYLHQREFRYERIDGSITGLKRQAAIDRFQAIDGTGREAPFIMLLSTKAGGVGINLTAADTCIIFDSDWNPQNDLQAQARCHRIGQTKNVKIYRLLTRKTYEMQMFHMSSLKMGLDQAVLQGIENTGGNKDLMTKEEVERLLKNGAYDIFKEIKDGTAEKESNDFISQDIDSILERRAKTIVHENTGSNSNAAGGAFSKASFQSNSDIAEVDVHDPDFWSKVVGEVSMDDDDDILATGQKRRRGKTNYSEADVLRQLDVAINADGYAVSGDECDDRESVASKFSEPDFSEEEDLEDFENDALVQIVQATKNKRNKERHLWGGTGATEWQKNDVEQVLKALQSFGYNNISWDKFISYVSFSKTMNIEEVKRICWSLSLLCLQEAAQEYIDDFISKSKLDAKCSESSRDVLSRIGSESDNVTKNEKGCHEKKHTEFLKFISAYDSWTTKALNDAVTYSKTTQPRNRDFVRNVLNGMSSTPNTEKENTVQTQLSLGFNDSIWPALRSRGWKVNDKAGKKNKLFTYDGQSYKGIASVLNVVTKKHPELTNMVNSLIFSVQALRTEVETLKVEAFDPSNISAESLNTLLMDFAPLQLLADRNTPDRIKLHHNTMVVRLTMLDILHRIVNLTDEHLSTTATEDERNAELSKIIKISPKVSLPHPGWTLLHDSILIRAIAKHGYIDRQPSVYAIMNDKTIRWGPPFEAIEGVEREQQAISDHDATICSRRKEDALLSVSKRAVAFLNHAKDNFLGGMQITVLYEIQEQLKKAFCLSGSHDEGWRIDEDRLKLPSFWEKDSDSYDVLPPKKALMTRLRKIVKSFIESSNTNESRNIHINNTSMDRNDESKNYGFSVIDQSVRCNTLLVEMLRGLLKSTRKQNVKEYVQLIIQEINSRHDELNESGKESTQLDELEKIKRHMGLFIASYQREKRSSKNILRVILGIEPVPSKSTTDTLFPSEQKSAAKDSKMSLITLRTISQTPADSALSHTSLTLENVCQSEKKSCQVLRLTSTEILMLTVMASQGLPVYCDDWNNLIMSKVIFENDRIGSDEDFQIYFFAMGGIMQAAAEVWLNVAAKKLRERVELLKHIEHTDTSREKLVTTISVLEKDLEAKKMTLADCFTLNKDSLTFAKSCIILLEALRKNMGPVDMNYTGDKKIRLLNKSENGLGTKVLSWFTKELFKWATPLGLVDTTGNIFSTTSINSSSDHLQCHDAALLTKRDCRTIFIQIAQQTRLRSIFIKYSTSKLSNEIIPQAIKQSTTDWENCPSWWNSECVGCCTCQDDLDLLVGILDYGYGGFDSMLQHEFTFCTKVKEEFIEGSREFTRAMAQARVNQLTRDLHIIDDNEETMKLIAQRKECRLSIVNVAGKKNSCGGIQAEIHTFFKRPAESLTTQSSKRQKTPPTSPDHSEVEVISMD